MNRLLLARARHKVTQMVFASLTSEVKLASAKNLTCRVIDFVHQNRLTSKMTIGIDIADANNKEFGLKTVGEKDFVLARKNHFKWLPKKQFFNWEFGINNYSNTVISNVYPNISLNKKQLMLCIGTKKANGYATFTLQFDRLYWLNTMELTNFLTELKEFLEKGDEKPSCQKELKVVNNPNKFLPEQKQVKHYQHKKPASKLYKW